MLIKNFKQRIKRTLKEGTLFLERRFRELPGSIMIEPTNACNFSCTMCANPIMTRKRRFMDLELFNLILSRCAQENIYHLYLFTVGESLLHPEFLEMLRLADLCPTVKTIEIYTNGSLLDERMAEEIIKINKCVVNFSFSGWDKESYEQRYSGGVFEQAVKNIERFNQLVQEKRMSLDSFRVYGIIDDDLAKRRTIDLLRNKIGLEPFNIGTNRPSDWAGFVSIKDKISSNENNIKKTKGRYVCSFLYHKNGILYDGRVTACGCHDINGDLIIGDIRKQSLREIRKGQDFKNIIQKFKDGDLNGLICNNCPHKKWVAL